jgi:hypothetical protein
LVGPDEKDVWFRIHVGGGILQMVQALMFTANSPPPADNHMLLSYPLSIGSTVPTALELAGKGGAVSWTSSSYPSTDRLRLSFTPVTVTAGGIKLPNKKGLGTASDGAGWWEHDPKTGAVQVNHMLAADVVISAH